MIQSYLTFHLGEEVFAANVDKVLEILEVPKITHVPCAPEFLRGVINLRGTVLPVIDTRLKFGLPSVDDNINTCIIVLKVNVEENEIIVGATVDSVQEVAEINSNQIQAPPSIGSKYKSEFISGMVKREESFAMILNLNLVFSTTESSLLNEVITNESSTIKNV